MAEGVHELEEEEARCGLVRAAPAAELGEVASAQEAAAARAEKRLRHARGSGGGRKQRRRVEALGGGVRQAAAGRGGRALGHEDDVAARAQDLVDPDDAHMRRAELPQADYFLGERIRLIRGEAS